MNETILVVDDDVDGRETVADILQAEGYKVAVATQGEDALRYLERTKVLPDTILLDLMMPVMDGLQFRTAQLNDRRIADIPVVVMSALPRSDPKLVPMRPTGYLRKPLDLDLLLAAVEACRQKEGESRSSPDPYGA